MYLSFYDLVIFNGRNLSMQTNDGKSGYYSFHPVLFNCHATSQAAWHTGARGPSSMRIDTDTQDETFSLIIRAKTFHQGSLGCLITTEARTATSTDPYKDLSCGRTKVGTANITMLRSAVITSLHHRGSLIVVSTTMYL
jgi:hypothetical protein